MIRILDLGCSAGGASIGLALAGWQVAGVDIRPQPRYPFPFTLGDALTVSLEGYDAYWASMPCQRYSYSTPTWARNRHLDLIGPLRDRLLKTGKPFILENVPGSPLRVDIVLCGKMFDLPLVRHRHFEVEGWKIPQPPHVPHTGRVVQLTGGGACRTPTRPGQGGPRYKVSADEARSIMHMPHATKRECCEAVHPLYAYWLASNIQ